MRSSTDRYLVMLLIVGVLQISILCVTLLTVQSVGGDLYHTFRKIDVPHTIESTTAVLSNAKRLMTDRRLETILDQTNLMVSELSTGRTETSTLARTVHTTLNKANELLQTVDEAKLVRVWTGLERATQRLLTVVDRLDDGLLNEVDSAVRVVAGDVVPKVQSLLAQLNRTMVRLHHTPIV